MKTFFPSTTSALADVGTGTAFMRDSPYSDTGDRLKHQHNIERLAEEIHRPVQEVASLYEDVLTQLQVSARIKDFLPVLVTKNVKQILRKH